MQDPRTTLNKITIFSDLGNDELEALYSRMTLVKCREGEVLFREGDEGRELFVIVDGTVNISVRLPDGSQLPLADIGRGNFFGEMSIIENAPRSATCRAAKSGVFLSLHTRDFYDLIRLHPDTAMKIMSRMLNIISERLMNTGTLLSEMVRWGEGARKRAITDEFTGLFNRRFLDESMVTAAAQAQAVGKPLCMVMMDLDHFGDLNKRYGESAGDSVIISAVAEIRRVFRTRDILVRYGGDEFAFILPDTDTKTAAGLCRTLCRRIRTLKFPDIPDMKITSSIGISAIPEHADSPAALQEAADRALYSAKERGRDRAEVARHAKD